MQAEQRKKLYAGGVSRKHQPAQMQFICQTFAVVGMEASQDKDFSLDAAPNRDFRQRERANDRPTSSARYRTSVAGIKTVLPPDKSQIGEASEQDVSATD